MKSSTAFSIFLLMVVIFLTSNYHDKFNDIETIFSVLFWFFILGLLTLSAIMPFLDNSKNRHDDE